MSTQMISGKCKTLAAVYAASQLTVAALLGCPLEGAEITPSDDNHEYDWGCQAKVWRAGAIRPGRTSLVMTLAAGHSGERSLSVPAPICCVDDVARIGSECRVREPAARRILETVSAALDSIWDQHFVAPTMLAMADELGQRGAIHGLAALGIVHQMREYFGIAERHALSLWDACDKVIRCRRRK